MTKRPTGVIGGAADTYSTQYSIKLLRDCIFTEITKKGVGMVDGVHRKRQS